MGARLKLATIGQQEYTTAQRALFDIAQRIGVPIQETATLYGKLQQAVRMLGAEQKNALTITESISQALRLSGATATEAQSSLLQFGQALAAGVLRGEEFNSVVENSPRLALALANGLNVPIGRLRKLAEEGRLTADVVVNALLSQKDKLASEYAQLPQTVSQALQRLQNAFGQWVSQVDAATGTSKKLADALTWLSTNLDTVMRWLKTLQEVGLAVLVYRLLPGAHHGLADRRCGRRHGRGGHVGRLGHRQSIGERCGGQCRCTKDRLWRTRGLCRGLGDRYLAVREIRVRQTHWHPDGRSPGPGN